MSARRVVEQGRRAASLGADAIVVTAPVYSLNDADEIGDHFRLVAEVVDVPVIASGGAGTVQHFVDAARAGADAVLAASVFHYGTLSIAEVKQGLAEAGFPVRQSTLTT